MKTEAFAEMSLAELYEERAHWSKEVSRLTGWGAALTAASEFRDACDTWIARREAEKRARIKDPEWKP